MRPPVRTVNLQNGEQIFTFSDEWNTQDGKVRELHYKLAPGISVAGHKHPHTSQTFRVVSGELWIRNGWKKMRLGPGDSAKTPPGGVHSQWNSSRTKEVVVVEGYDPPLNIEPFFTHLPEVLKQKNPFKICVFFDDHANVVTSRTAVVRLTIAAIAHLGRRLGYSGWYRSSLPLRQ